MSPSPGYLVTDYHDAGGPDQRRTASKYIDTPPRVTRDKLVSAASDASDEAAIESCYDQTVWAATELIVFCNSDFHDRGRRGHCKESLAPCHD